ncbi:glycerate kinase [bacterium AH-315-A23]|nr:glycerate kinase [bacterium AH-315-A23]
MKIILAPDKFKGSLTGIEFCNAVEEGLKLILPKVEISKLPLADGGDGTIEILDYHLKGKRITINVKDPLFKTIEASYLYIESKNTAFIEMAEASGMKLLPTEKQNCFLTTTFGTGEIIQHAIYKGAKTIVLGIGGSATNDCGIGMATALGYKFIDKKGNEVIPIGKNLSKIDKIDFSNVNKRLKTVTFKVACDVTNPLHGKEGAAYVYGLQKGASIEEVTLLNKGLEHFSNVLLEHFNIDVQEIRGAGAAGGMGAGALVFLDANLLPGIELVKEIIDFDKKIKDADWIITGEGKLDSQTLSGKTIQGVLKSAKTHNIQVAVLCGSISLQKEVLNDLGISYVNSIMDIARNFEDAMSNSYKYLAVISSDFAKTINRSSIV